MSLPYSRAPHSEGVIGTQREALNAALLIDFDNVTMGMRSDLSKELNSLLNSDIIKGKVTVQRAYADWRRYPQYIVPLSEHSVDLIFAPAYGSSKKNATDIRMAIDAMELVFIRPEIGTFILLTGDSDFSSLVLKLKEYGKYVIGVGIQESSSDILVQNCDEYYSYTSLTGLRKTTDSANKAVDPWVLVEQAVERMASRDDVMRSDRLKQVMIEIDPTFDEGNFGFSKFSRFLSEAGSRDLVTLRKLDNGQYEVTPTGGRSKGSGGQARSGGQGKSGGASRSASQGRSGNQGKDASRKSSSRSRSGGRDQDEASGGSKSRDGGRKGARSDRKDPGGAESRSDTDSKKSDGSKEGKKGEQGQTSSGDPLKRAYELVREAIRALSGGPDGEESVRDSDLKRKILQLDSSFDEGELGFGKFSRFLRQAHDHEVVDLEKRDDGTYQVALPGRPGAEPQEGTGREESDRAGAPPESAQEPEPSGSPEAGSSEESDDPSTAARPTRGGLRMRRGGSGRRKEPEGPPPLLEGQVVSASGSASSGSSASDATKPAGTPEPEEDGGADRGLGPRSRRGRSRPSSSGSGRESREGSTEPLDSAALALPTGGQALIRYLTNSYKGVGKKTAERVVEEFGSELFQVLHAHPERLDAVIPPNRADQLLRGWRSDLARRLERRGEEGNGGGGKNDKSEKNEERSSGRRRTRRGSRSRGRSGGGGS